MKAISLAGKDRALFARLWHQVATVRAQNGDEAGARKAEEKLCLLGARTQNIKPKVLMFDL